MTPPHLYRELIVSVYRRSIRPFGRILRMDNAAELRAHVDEFGDTLAHHIARSGWEEAILLMVTHDDWDPSARNVYGAEPSDVARANGHESLSLLLGLLSRLEFSDRLEMAMIGLGLTKPDWFVPAMQQMASEQAAESLIRKALTARSQIGAADLDPEAGELPAVTDDELTQHLHAVSNAFAVVHCDEAEERATMIASLFGLAEANEALLLRKADPDTRTALRDASWQLCRLKRVVIEAVTSAEEAVEAREQLLRKACETALQGWAAGDTSAIVHAVEVARRMRQPSTAIVLITFALGVPGHESYRADLETIREGLYAQLPPLPTRRYERQVVAGRDGVDEAGAVPTFPADVESFFSSPEAVDLQQLACNYLFEGADLVRDASKSSRAYEEGLLALKRGAALLGPGGDWSAACFENLGITFGQNARGLAELDEANALLVGGVALHESHDDQARADAAARIAARNGGKGFYSIAAQRCRELSRVWRRHLDPDVRAALEKSLSVSTPPRDSEPVARSSGSRISLDPSTDISGETSSAQHSTEGLSFRPAAASILFLSLLTFAGIWATREENTGASSPSSAPERATAAFPQIAAVQDGASFQYGYRALGATGEPDERGYCFPVDQWGTLICYDENGLAVSYQVSGSVEVRPNYRLTTDDELEAMERATPIDYPSEFTEGFESCEEIAAAMRAWAGEGRTTDNNRTVVTEWNENSVIAVWRRSISKDAQTGTFSASCVFHADLQN